MVLKALGHPSASLGTLGLVIGAERRPGALTTPDPVALHRDLGGLASQGIHHAAIEASSHGLDQFRLDGISVAAAAFTNLTRDHLDYHGDMELPCRQGPAVHRTADAGRLRGSLPGTVPISSGSKRSVAIAVIG